MKTFDILIATQGYVRVMNEGFYEKVIGRDFDESKYTTFIIGDTAYRVNIQDYHSKKAIFDKFFNKCEIRRITSNMKKNIIINDQTVRKELIEAINIFEINCKCTILKFSTHCDNTFTMVEYDGNCVTSWTGNINDFFERKVEHFEITGIM